LRNESTHDERGAMTLWVLGLCIAVLFLGGLSLDLWRVIAVRRSLVAMADAGATAGANGLDEDALRRGVLRVDPVLARALASATLREQSGWSGVDGAEVDVAGNRVTVTVRAHVGFTLLGIFVRGDPVDVEASASAEPREEP
jgi:Flp pilus assembly protein TadG